MKSEFHLLEKQNKFETL